MRFEMGVPRRAETTILVDWGVIQNKQEFYKQVLPQLQAPEWHGHNLDALSDSLAVGQINGIEPPYIVEMRGIESIPGHLAEFAEDVLSIWRTAAAQRSGIEIRITPGKAG